ncbi:MAG: cupin domain-containing protein [Bermanella sp.]
MKHILKTTALTTALLAATFNSNAGESENTHKLLTVNFDTREVVKIEAGDFHFVPGQPAPIHTHAAPAVGYVSKGAILYQVEGEKPQLLKEGDAFYEPVGPRILRFDNASKTEEAVFIDFNLQQAGEPFIVFEKELTEHIDRRTLPTLELEGKKIDQVDIFVSELAPSDKKNFRSQQPVLAYVAEGVVLVKIKGQKTQRVVAGASFSLPSQQSTSVVVNESNEVAAKVIAFHLK